MELRLPRINSKAAVKTEEIIAVGFFFPFMPCLSVAEPKRYRGKRKCITDNGICIRIAPKGMGRSTNRNEPNKQHKPS